MGRAGRVANGLHPLHVLHAQAAAGAARKIRLFKQVPGPAVRRAAPLSAAVSQSPGYFSVIWRSYPAHHHRETQEAAERRVISG